MKLVHKFAKRQQLWLLIAYTLGLLAVFGMNNGTSRQIITGVAATVLVVVIALTLRARFSTGCAGASTD